MYSNVPIIFYKNKYMIQDVYVYIYQQSDSKGFLRRPPGPFPRESTTVYTRSVKIGYLM